MSCTASATPTSVPRENSLAIVGQMNSAPLTTAIDDQPDVLLYELHDCSRSVATSVSWFVVDLASARTPATAASSASPSSTRRLTTSSARSRFVREGGHRQIPLPLRRGLVAVQRQQHGLAIDHVVDGEQLHRPPVDRQLVCQVIGVDADGASQSELDVWRQQGPAMNLQQQRPSPGG